MTKVLVTYYSQSGNTRKVAEAIYGGISADKEMEELEKVESLQEYALIFVGFPLHANGPAKPAKDFLENKARGKKLAIFVTHAAHEDSPLLQEWLEACKQAAAGADLVAFFNCQGELADDIAGFMSASGDASLEAWAKERPRTLGQPDASRLELARVFGREALGKYTS